MIIGVRLLAILEFALCVMIVVVLISFLFAIAAAVWRGGWIDRLALLFSLLGLSLLNFWLGLLLMIIFSIQLGWALVSGRGGLSHLFLLALMLGLGMAAILICILRASLLRAMIEDYVQTARAKGLPERRVWLKHTLRNALTSVVTIMSLQFGSVLA